MKMGLFKVNTLVFVVLLVQLCKSEQTPTISYITPEQVKDLNESVTLSCTVQNAEGGSVVWMKLNEDDPTSPTILTMGSSLAMSDNRFNFTASNSGNGATYSLKISNLAKHDKGKYVCKLQMNMGKTESKNVELHIKYPPTVEDNAADRTVTVAEGSSTQLICTADGYPRATFSWKRLNNAILPFGGQSYSGRSLDLKNVNRVDRGVYICTADNGIGKSSKNINLEVEFAPFISIPRPKVAQALEYDIELKCVVQAYPSPSITWFKNGKELFNGDSYQIVQTGTTLETTISTVKIQSLEKHNYGDYHCKATNKVGSAEARLNLFEPSIPVVYSWNTI